MSQICYAEGVKIRDCGKDEKNLGLDPHLFVKVPRPGDSEVTFAVFDQAATCYYQSNHSKVEAISLSALPKDTTSELAGYVHTNPFKC